MVLSNKRLKQKLRAAALAESLVAASEEAQKDRISNVPTNPEPNSQTQQSLKSLLVLGSGTHKPRLSKREKRRKTLSLRGPEDLRRSGGGDSEKGDKEGGSESANEKKGNRKRKRDEGLESGALAENVEVKSDKKKKKMHKNKKKKKKKKGKKADIEEVKEDEKLANGGSEQGVTDKVKAIDSQETAEVSTKVYVGGIPYYSTEDDIRSYFEGCGTVTEVDCMKFPESGKFRGIAIISFKTEAAAKRALALDESDMGGLFLKIQPYKSTRAKKVSDFAPAIVEGYNRIYVGNLSWDITEDELRKLFSDCSISSIRFGEDKETGEFRGYAHVDFTDSLSLNMALKLDQKMVCGRSVRIQCAVPAKKVRGSNSKSFPESKKTESNPKSLVESKIADDGGTSCVSGKIRRRTCYECGEKGHLSSSCPKKQATEATNSSTT